MRKLFFICSLVLAVAASAAPKKKQKSEYQTSHSFNGAQINGRLQEGHLRKIVVEDDKSIEDLLGVRKKFDDREQDEKERVVSW